MTHGFGISATGRARKYVEHRALRLGRFNIALGDVVERLDDDMRDAITAPDIFKN